MPNAGRPPDRWCEKLAGEWLAANHFPVVHEPLGRDGDDFINATHDVGIEVTRIKWQFETGGHLEPALTALKSVISMIEKICAGFGAGSLQSTYYLRCSFQRPLNLRSLPPKIIEFLNLLSTGAVPEDQVLQLENFRLRLLRGSKYMGCAFKMGSIIDRDAVGWTGPSIVTGIKRAIAMKECRVRRRPKPAGGRWLVLVNSMLGVLTRQDSEVISRAEIASTEFDRIFVINPCDPGTSLQVLPRAV